ncbi:hypothetical protein PTSG_12434 [Salpingoeca rosetta]|uniref:Procollagen-lysine 5-dioxygenase n=1 Tax=Salpingoeca rosetta (strain ATCC 50818 / BSB-021) TaxID=946362 RepID=F2UCM2_SALR5|nr:uncharacterized protein PTSG_12434 [Salpingoeca rosetta]EGD74329.1 hypothetical protein PTSG_12434 [Salpingoeca rosetta]|eukprot:XP_004993229.1 hypothetical protein PTSG_12434 [Salpingoeca rosetta]
MLRMRRMSTTVTATATAGGLALLLLVSVSVVSVVSVMVGASGAEQAGVETTMTGGSCDASNPSCSTTNLALRRRVWNPPEPLGPHESMYTKASVAVQNSGVLHVVARRSQLGDNDAWDAFTDSLAVQGLEATYVSAGAGLGSKELRDVAEQLANTNPNDVVLFIGDAEDTVLLAEATELTRKFNALDCGILFPAAIRCKRRCAMDWPLVPEGHGRFLVPSAFMAKGDKFKLLVDSFPDLSTVPNMSESDQLIALFMTDRDFYGMKLDTNFAVFQPLFGYKDEWPAAVFAAEYEFHSEEDTRLRNKDTSEYPGILISHGNTKLLTQLNNYMPLKWHPDTQSLTSKTLESVDPNAAVTIAFNVLPESPFLQLVLDGIAAQDLLRTHPVTFVAAVVDNPHAHTYVELVQNFTRDNKQLFAGVTVLHEPQEDSEQAMRKLFTVAMETQPTTHVLYHTSAARLMNSTVLGELLAQDLRVVSPMMTREASFFSNFWGAATGDRDAQCFDDSAQCEAWAVAGECTKNEPYMKKHCQRSCEVCHAQGAPENIKYRRSADYMSIIKAEQTGTWAVPLVSEVILMKLNAFNIVVKALSQLETQPGSPLRFDFPLTAYLLDQLRSSKVKLHVDNRHFYGLLINPDGFNANSVHPDVFLLAGNEQHWRDLYIHPDYEPYKKLEFVQGRCWDIYNFPLFSELFCAHFIDVSEAVGTWSSGSNSDDRLKSGYEPVPTRDIHFNQMGFQETWTAILRRFVAPVAETQWVGYKLDGRVTLDFVVKYQPEGQPFLRKHHDASTFSLNVALNRIGEDFEGGGTRFTRQNCTVLTNKMGHALIHPGRLTHQHEGLYVTKGTRYIIVSFVDQV